MPSVASQGGIEQRSLLVYSRYCHMPNCNIVRHGGTKWCRHHRNLTASRGAPNQNKIGIRTLNTARKAVQELVNQNRNSEAWKTLIEVIEDRKKQILRQATEELTANTRENKASAKPRRVALQMLLEIYQKISTEEALVEYAMVQYLNHTNDRLFVSDEVVKFWIVKRLLAKSKVFHASTLDRITGKPKRYSVQITSTLRDIVYWYSHEIFRAIGIQLADQVSQRHEKYVAMEQKYRNAIAQIK
jgi:hypothetical protein